MRNVILHYHFFKNAGTSFDGVLKQNFKGKWVEREFPNSRGAEHQAEVAKWILSQPEAIAFSSHTMDGPPPKIPGINVVPYVFIRHPILRLKSVYEFERKQMPHESVGSRLAHGRTFSEYVEGRLAINGDRQCKNFHCARLARWIGSDEDEFTRASQVLLSLPAFGIVERFEKSMENFASAYKSMFPFFKPTSMKLNSSSVDGGGMSLSKIEAELGVPTFSKIMKLNQNDLNLYDVALKAFEFHGDPSPLG